MKRLKAIEVILKYYNEEKKHLEYKENNAPFNYESINWTKGELCGLRYVLIEVYDFKPNDKRF